MAAARPDKLVCEERREGTGDARGEVKLCAFLPRKVPAHDSRRSLLAMADKLT